MRRGGLTAGHPSATIATPRGVARFVVALAQPAEHRIVDPKVMGSTPIGHPTILNSNQPGSASFVVSPAARYLILVVLVVLAKGPD